MFQGLPRVTDVHIRGCNPEQLVHLHDLGVPCLLKLRFTKQKGVGALLCDLAASA